MSLCLIPETSSASLDYDPVDVLLVSTYLHALCEHDGVALSSRSEIQFELIDWGLIHQLFCWSC